MKKLALGLSICAAAFIIGCGGGSSNTSSATKTVSGSIEASKLAGIKVCLKGSSKCAITDENGKFVLTGVTLPATLEIKIGNSVFADVNVNSEDVNINPLVLSDNNSTLAGYIGAFLHEVSGCDMGAQKCDFSGKNDVKITDANGTTILEALMKSCSDGKVEINVDGNNIEVNKSTVTMYENANPTMVSKEVSYKGAVGVGDFASFKFNPDNNVLSYHLSGAILGNEEGNVTLKNKYANVFFTDKDGDVFFFSGSLGLALTEYNNTIVPVVGLQSATTLDTSLIINKRFNFIEIDSSGIDFNIVEVNGSAGENNGTWSDAYGDTGNWELNATHLDACQNTGSGCEEVAHFVIRPPVVQNGRAGLIVDDLDGGFSIGIEAKPLNANEISGRYYYEDISRDGTVCYGYVDVNGTSFSYYDEWCSDGDEDTGNGSLVLNPQVDPDNNASTDNNITLNGFAQVKDESGNLTKEFVIIDPVEGYYIAIDAENGDISIGSNKPLK